MTSFVPLEDARDATRFGGKAAGLAECVRAGIAVPSGVALAHDASASGDALAAALGFPLAVRSSAIGEDGATASFAGQHESVLDVRSVTALDAAIATVRASASSSREYRRRLGLPETCAMGVVVQRYLEGTCGGVMFTRDPVTGEDVLVIEASRSASAVVAGEVIPEHVRATREGRVLHRQGEDAALDEQRVAALAALAAACDRAFGTAGHDVEWIFADRLYLLQRRPITTGQGLP